MYLWKVYSLYTHIRWQLDLLIIKTLRFILFSSLYLLSFLWLFFLVLFEVKVNSHLLCSSSSINCLFYLNNFLDWIDLLQWVCFFEKCLKISYLYHRLNFILTLFIGEERDFFLKKVLLKFCEKAVRVNWLWFGQNDLVNGFLAHIKLKSCPYFDSLLNQTTLYVIYELRKLTRNQEGMTLTLLNSFEQRNYNLKPKIVSKSLKQSS